MIPRSTSSLRIIVSLGPLTWSRGPRPLTQRSGSTSDIEVDVELIIWLLERARVKRRGERGWLASHVLLTEPLSWLVISLDELELIEESDILSEEEVELSFSFG